MPEITLEEYELMNRILSDRLPTPDLFFFKTDNGIDWFTIRSIVFCRFSEQDPYRFPFPDR